MNKTIAILLALSMVFLLAKGKIQLQLQLQIHDNTINLVDKNGGFKQKKQFTSKKNPPH